MKKQSSWVYIMANASHSVLYIGVTSNIERRTWEHKAHAVPGFTVKYNVDKLVYTEECERIEDAIAREKQLKGWRRDKKVKLIEGLNPDWKDLAAE